VGSQMAMQGQGQGEGQGPHQGGKAIKDKRCQACLFPEAARRI